VVTGRSQVWVPTQTWLRVGTQTWLWLVTTCICKPEAAIQLELLMMSGVPLNTCWAVNERRNSKFCYKAASCWLFLLSHTVMHGSMNIKLIYKNNVTSQKFLFCTVNKLPCSWSHFASQNPPHTYTHRKNVCPSCLIILILNASALLRHGYATGTSHRSPYCSNTWRDIV